VERREFAGVFFSHAKARRREEGFFIRRLRRFTPIKENQGRLWQHVLPLRGNSRRRWKGAKAVVQWPHACVRR